MKNAGRQAGSCPTSRPPVLPVPAIGGEGSTHMSYTAKSSCGFGVEGCWYVTARSNANLGDVTMHPSYQSVTIMYFSHLSCLANIRQPGGLRARGESHKPKRPMWHNLRACIEKSVVHALGIVSKRSCEIASIRGIFGERKRGEHPFRHQSFEVFALLHAWQTLAKEIDAWRLGSKWLGSRRALSLCPTMAKSETCGGSSFGFVPCFPPKYN